MGQEASTGITCCRDKMEMWIPPSSQHGDSQGRSPTRRSLHLDHPQRVGVTLPGMLCLGDPGPCLSGHPSASPVSPRTPRHPVTGTGAPGISATGSARAWNLPFEMETLGTEAVGKEKTSQFSCILSTIVEGWLTCAGLGASPEFTGGAGQGPCPQGAHSWRTEGKA